MIHQFLTFALLSASVCLAAPSEGQRDFELQHAENSVPHLGKKSALPIDVPSFTSGFLPPTYPKYMQTRFDKRDSFPTSWHIGKRDPWTEHMVNIVYGQPDADDSTEVPEKRAPWTGAWANVVWKPADLQKSSLTAGKRAPWTSSWGALLKPTTTQEKSRSANKRSAIPNDQEPNDSSEVPEKRAPWTGAWANVVWKPADLQKSSLTAGKRAPWTSTWGALVKPTTTQEKSRSENKRSAIPNDWNSPWENMIRSPQGFRFHDAGTDFLSRDVMYKRGGDFTSNLNSVPMIGKRDPEPYISSDGHPNSDQSMETYDYQEGGRLMDDAALVSSR